MTADRVALELCRLAALVEGVVEDQQHVERRQLAGDDRCIGSVLLPLAAELTNGRTFTGPGLYTQALNDRTPAGQAAREIMDEYGNLRALGKLLARLDGIVLGGHRLAPAGERRDGRAWRVKRVSDD